MREIDPSHVKEQKTKKLLVVTCSFSACSFSAWRRRLFMFFRHYASREVSCEAIFSQDVAKEGRSLREYIMYQ